MGLLDDLRSVGYEVRDVWDLGNTGIPYPKAIPVLLKHLVMPYSDRNREGIARALAVPDPQVRDAWPLLVSEYRNAPSGNGHVARGDIELLRLGSKDALAVALAASVTNTTLEDLIDLVCDRSLGDSRILLLSPLRRRRKKNERVRQVLEKLALDPDLKIEIESWR